MSSNDAFLDASRDAARRTSRSRGVPSWIWDVPVSERPCPGCRPDEGEEPGACWRTYTSNEDVDGLPSGMKQVRCPSWAPAAMDFAVADVDEAAKDPGLPGGLPGDVEIRCNAIGCSFRVPLGLDDGGDRAVPAILDQLARIHAWDHPGRLVSVSAKVAGVQRICVAPGIATTDDDLQRAVVELHAARQRDVVYVREDLVDVVAAEEE